MQQWVRWTLIVGCVSAAGVVRAAPEPKNAEDLVARLEATAASLQDYEVNYEVNGEGKRDHFKLYYKRPDLVRLDAKRGEVSVQPNGDIRGRMGKGPFGFISRKLGRNDPQLRDDEGIPFWEFHYPAAVARIRSQLRSGATASMTTGPETYTLTLRSGDVTWQYVIDKATMFFRENSRSVNGKQVEVTRYSNYRPNAGLKTSVFKF